MGQYAHLPLTDFFDQVYLPYRLRSCSALTPECFLTPLKHLEVYWRSRDPVRAGQRLTIAGLSEALIAQYLASRTDLGAATQNKHLRHIKAVWNQAVDVDEQLGKFRLKPVRENLTEPECWTQEEFARLLLAAAEQFGRVGDVPARYWWPALILMIYATGVRINAVMHIRVSDLDLDNGQVIVRAASQKQKADQRFTLIPETVAMLRVLQPQRNHCIFDDWSFDKKTRGGRRNFSTLGTHYKQILKRAQLTASRKDLWHKLRRMFATEVARTAGKAAAQTLLGHSTMKVTERYLDKRFLEAPNAAELLRRPVIPIQLRLFNPNDPGPDATGDAMTG